MRKFFRQFHLWVSIPFGLVITVICFTGALLVFEDEVTSLCNDGITMVQPVGEPLSIDAIVEKVEDTLPDGVDVKGVVVSDSFNEAYKVNLSKPKKAAVYVNQYTGEVLGKDERLPFFQTVFRLHRWLMDSNPGDGSIFWGKVIVGASTLAFVVILLTGLFIWWPRNRKMLKNRLQIVIKKGKSRFWYDLHVAGGFYALLLLLAMALTGLNWSFEWYQEDFYDFFGADDEDEVVVVSEQADTMLKDAEGLSQECPGSCRTCALPVCVNTVGNGEEKSGVEEPTGVVQWNVDAVTAATSVVETQYVDARTDISIADVDAVTAATVVDAQSGATVAVDGNSGATTVETNSTTSASNAWQTAFENVVARVSQYKTITVSAGSVSVKDSYYGNVRAADKYLFDENSGEITGVELYEEADKESKIGGWIYSVHVGSWGGYITKILSFLVALLGATLPLTGYYLWIRRLYGKRKSRK
ncbi:MAG: PepSY domain-containing protein [Bacteroidaceae bacterium]|nr:PepSY domain-containing protein [Bacteroidaceae bacterium]